MRCQTCPQGRVFRELHAEFQTCLLHQLRDGRVIDVAYPGEQVVFDLKVQAAEEPVHLRVRSYIGVEGPLTRLHSNVPLEKEARGPDRQLTWWRDHSESVYLGLTPANVAKIQMP
jgi:hypothetical protein